MRSVKGTANGSAPPSGLRRDTFTSDGAYVGLRDNEMDGVVDEFSVQDAGEANAYHDNIPESKLFYAFAVMKTEVSND